MSPTGSVHYVVPWRHGGMVIRVANVAKRSQILQRNR